MFIPADAKNLTEDTSIALVQQIKYERIATDFTNSAIATTYVQQGRGDTPILLLHGFDSSLLEFRRLVPLLSLHRETWAVDLLGFGFCDRSEELSFSTVELKTHLYYFWKTLIQRPVILVGASMGGAVALDFTLTYPETVAKLVLLDSAGLANPPKIGKFMFPPLDYLATAFLRNSKVRQNISRAAYYDKTFANADAQLCASLHLQCPRWSESLIGFTKNGGYGSFAAQLDRIQQSTLIVWGANDKILGIKDASKFARAMPANKLVWIEECGHVPHLEKPQATAQAILDW